jgi:DNA end-binding protein Ku
VAEEPPTATNVVDPMQMLQGSIDQARGGRVGGGEPRQKKTGQARKTARKPAAKGAKKTAAQKAPPKTARASSASRGQAVRARASCGS